MMTKYELQQRTKKFHVDIIKLCTHFPKNAAGFETAKQLIRSAGSVGSNYRAACRGKSGDDFIYKIEVVLEEADESLYWLQVSKEAGLAEGEELERLLAEANELVSIFNASDVTAKKNRKSKEANQKISKSLNLKISNCNMTYKAIGLMSGSSLDGLDIVFAELNDNAGSWNYEIIAADCYEYPAEWSDKLKNAITLNALDYQLLHAEYGHYLGKEINRFIEENNLHYQTGVVGSHGHTTFHVPQKQMTAQLGDGAAIAAETGLRVVSDLRALDIAFGGQGAPIVPIGEKLLLKDYDMYLNLGGIANISFNLPDKYIAFDICAANRVLNMIANEDNKQYDAGGKWRQWGILTATF